MSLRVVSPDCEACIISYSHELDVRAINKWVNLDLILWHVTQDNSVFDNDTRVYLENTEHVFALYSQADQVFGVIAESH